MERSETRIKGPMLGRLIVAGAYGLKVSRHYRHAKLFFHDLLEHPDSRLKIYFDRIMTGLVIVSVLLLIFRTDMPLTALDNRIERIITLVFIGEYLLRVWLVHDSHDIVIRHYETARYLGVPFRWASAVSEIAAAKLNYLLSPMALIDLLAILPSYEPQPIWRFFIVFRLLKLFRYFRSLKLFTEVLAIKQFELLTLAVFLSFIVFIGSTAVYLFEKPGGNHQVNTLFDAVYFALVTVSTVGYGDITPHTTGGRIVAIMLILSGLAVFSLLISIIVSAFNDKMKDMREHRAYQQIKRYKNFVIICGFGRVGEHIAARLAKDRQTFVVIDIDADNTDKAKQLGYQTLQADASQNQVLINAGINNPGICGVLCTTGNDVINVYITLTSRHLNPDVRIISRANKQDNVKKLYQAGANDVIQPFEIAALVAAEYIGQPVAFEAIFGILRQERQFIMEAVKVKPNSMVDNACIADLHFKQRKLILIGVVSSNPLHQIHKNRYRISHQHFYFNPEPHFALQAGDLLVLLGRDISIDHFRAAIRQSQTQPGRRP